MVIDNIWDYATTEEIPMGFKTTNLATAGPHNHSFVEIFYVVSGSMRHSVNGGSEKVLKTGDAYIIMPDSYHTFSHTQEHETCLHRDIMIRESFFKEVCAFIDPSFYDKLISGETSCHAFLSPVKMNYLEEQINMINQLIPTSMTQKKSIIKSLAMTLLEPFLSHNDGGRLSVFPAWFNDLLSSFNTIEFMQQGLNKILKPFNYDRKYLCRVFKKYMGMTMTEYLNHIRLDYAMHAIQNTNKNILHIAQNLGFSSVSYFNVIFKKRYGITPLEARQKMSENSTPEE